MERIELMRSIALVNRGPDYGLSDSKQALISWTTALQP
jgi:hypothetical protein